MEEFGPDIYQLTLINGPTHTTSFINTTVDAKPGYLLNDLLKRHSERDNLWKVYGRTDDQISFSNALKASSYENKFIFLFVISPPQINRLPIGTLKQISISALDFVLNLL